ncbi:MAG: bifunctional hydroxymethylpyrimidine kinase/phosphomethylpyrimidine kinase [Methylobacteriaceae bacterium]|jgi:hydroxymethylpyrimidine/phosphomethylpyrimidine kinase|nr:bifunctional hydroxymethylpyrimidine kinase/phosphomethylpyrimidine kinase [Methylobacteriaceae bacterium]
MTAIALTIAGSDSGGGAGIQADLKTFSALRVYGASVIAALTAQNTLGVQGVYGIPPEFVAAQIDSVFADIPVNAVKIGMLASVDVIETVTERLDFWKAGPVVLDPVMVATSGDRLVSEEAILALKTTLVKRAAIITPNLPEAAVLLGEAPAADEKGMIAQAEALLQLGPKAVIVKGGHGHAAESVDYFVTADGVERLAAPRIATKNSHGTGCTLSSAIAAGLAKGEALPEAVRAAKAYITEAIRQSERLHIGSGNGPVHHFHRYW